jgi:hypothetical protein
MARLGTAVVIATLAIASIAGPVGAREFGSLYAEGDVYRTFENSTNPDQLSVARYAPGDGSHGGRWAVHHATWTSAADASILVTDYETLAAFAAQGRLLIVRDEAADFRCPILPNG